MASVAYAEAGSPGVLANKIGWINFGPDFVLIPNLGVPIQITNDIPGNYQINFNISLTQTGSPDIPIISVIPPTLPGASAFGITGYIGINEYVDLYMSLNGEGSQVILTITLDNITVIDKSTGININNYSIVAADNEDTNVTEIWTAITNGSSWIKLETLPAVNEPTSAYRIIGDGSVAISSSSITDIGASNGNVPSIVVSSKNPTTVIAILGTEIGRQGVTFGVIIDENSNPICNCLHIC